MNNSNFTRNTIDNADTRCSDAGYGMICRFDNPMPHCPVMLVLDTSHSMWGAGLADMMASLDAFFDTIRREQCSNAQIDIAAVSMGDNLGMLEEFTAFENSRLPQLKIRPKGDTPVGAALELALERLAARLQACAQAGQSVVTPQLIMLSDGESSDDFSAVAKEIRGLVAAGHLHCRIIATGENPDLAALRMIAGDNVTAAREHGMAATFAGVGEIVSQVYEDEAETILSAAEPADAACAGGTIYIDGSNVLHWDHRLGVSLKHLLAITQRFDREGIPYQVLFDASARYQLGQDERKIYEDLLVARPEEFQQIPAGTRADDFLLMFAENDPDSRIMSNDRYQQYVAQFPWITDRRRTIRGLATRGGVMLHDGDGVWMRISSDPAGNPGECGLNCQ